MENEFVGANRAVKKKEAAQAEACAASTSENYRRLVIVVIVVVVAMAVVIVILPAVVIAAIVFFVPTMIVLYAATFAFPIAVIEAFAIVARPDPAGAFIRRPGPVALMPAVMAANGIPVTANPDELRSGLSGKHCNHARRRWRANSDADRDLRVRGVGAG